MLIAIEKLRVKIGLDADDASKDAEIAIALDVAIDWLEKFLDRGIEYRSEVERFYHETNGTFQLYRYPIMDVINIISEYNAPNLVKSGVGAPITFVSVPENRELVKSPNAGDFHTDSKKGILYLDHYNRDHVVEVTYSGGYADDNLPAGLEMALLTLFDYVYGQMGNSSVSVSGIQSVSLQGVGTVRFETSGGTSSINFTTNPGGMLAEIIGPFGASIIERFRRWQA